jgi:hypothetical protein
LKRLEVGEIGLPIHYQSPHMRFSCDLSLLPRLVQSTYAVWR